LEEDIDLRVDIFFIQRHVDLFHADALRISLAVNIEGKDFMELFLL
jgi:hypothetical protein